MEMVLDERLPGQMTLETQRTSEVGEYFDLDGNLLFESLGTEASIEQARSQKNLKVVLNELKVKLLLLLICGGVQ
jgi:hypothetical protein